MINFSYKNILGHEDFQRLSVLHEQGHSVFRDWISLFYALYLGRCALWRGLLGGIIIAVLILIVARPLYQASITLAPVSRFADTAITPPAAKEQGGGLPYDMVLNALNNDGTDTRLTRYEEVLTGQRVAMKTKENKDLSIINRRVDRFILSGNPVIESDWLQRAVIKTRLQPSGLLTLKFRANDPKLARDFLTLLHNQTESLLKDDMKKRVQQRLDYLQARLKDNQNPYHRASLSHLLTEQEQLMMILNLDEPFLMEVVEPASTLPHPIWPRKSLILVLMAFFGAMMGGVFVLGQFYLWERRA